MMTLCKPCLERGRQTEAEKTMNGEPWCRWCFGGCIVPGAFDPDQHKNHPKRGPEPTIAFCRNTCGNRITARSKSGLCSACSRHQSSRLRNQARRTMVPCKKPGCEGRVRPTSKYGYCAKCLERDYELRAQFYPSQRKDRCIERAMKRHWAKKQVQVQEARV